MLVRSMSPIATWIERKLRDGLVKCENQYLLDDEAAVAQKRPAGLLHGLAPIGTSPVDDAVTGIADCWSACRGGNPPNPYFIASPAGAMLLSLWGATAGARLFPEASPMRGGSIGGVPLLIAREAGPRLILVDAACLLYTDGGFTMRPSSEAAIALTDSPAAAPQTTVSAFQTDSQWLRVLRVVTWATATDDCVAFCSLPRCR